MRKLSSTVGQRGRPRMEPGVSAKPWAAKVRSVMIREWTMVALCRKAHTRATSKALRLTLLWQALTALEWRVRRLLVPGLWDHTICLPVEEGNTLYQDYLFPQQQYDCIVVTRNFMHKHAFECSHHTCRPSDVWQRCSVQHTPTSCGPQRSGWKYRNEVQGCEGTERDWLRLNWKNPWLVEVT